MRSLQVTPKNADKCVDKFLLEAFPRLSPGRLHKTFRKRDVKVNGVRVKPDYIVSAGDLVEIYLTDDLLGVGTMPDAGTSPEAVRHVDYYTVVYEDENILIVNKRQGVSVHPDKEEDSITLINLVRDYIGKGRDGFQPSLCHRLDRNTGGLVVIAKNKESLDIIISSMKKGQIKKYYQCLVKGRIKPAQAELKAWLVKDDRKSRVFVNQEKTAGAAQIITRYKLLAYDEDKDISRLEIELVTGRTHQIRAHLASIGHPVIGDGKYGKNSINRPLGVKKQALWAYKLEFMLNEAGRLSYLKGKSFEVTPDFPDL
jgi:23S rRNA pseudouridine955/2504/2580 synthase